MASKAAKSQAAEKKRLQELKRQLELREKKVAEHEAKLRKKKQEIDAATRKLQHAQKELKKELSHLSQQKKLQKRKSLTAPHSNPISPRGGAGKC